MAKQPLLATIRDRYRASSKKDQSRILDEFIAVTGDHRKHGIRLLGKLDGDEGATHSVRGRRIYDEAVRAAVIVIWEAADRISSLQGGSFRQRRRQLLSGMLHSLMIPLVQSVNRHRFRVNVPRSTRLPCLRRFPKIRCGLLWDGQPARAQVRGAADPSARWIHRGAGKMRDQAAPH